MRNLLAVAARQSRDDKAGLWIMIRLPVATATTMKRAPGVALRTRGRNLVSRAHGEGR